MTATRFPVFSKIRDVFKNITLETIYRNGIPLVASRKEHNKSHTKLNTWRIILINIREPVSVRTRVCVCIHIIYNNNMYYYETTREGKATENEKGGKKKKKFNNIITYTSVFWTVWPFDTLTSLSVGFYPVFAGIASPYGVKTIPYYALRFHIWRTGPADTRTDRPKTFTATVFREKSRPFCFPGQAVSTFNRGAIISLNVRPDRAYKSPVNSRRVHYCRRQSQRVSNRKTR